MKKGVILILIINIYIISCIGPVVDHVGLSDFVLQNNTNNTLFYVCDLSGEYTEPGSLTGNVNSNEAVLLLEEIPGPIGMHPKPGEVFSTISLFSDETLVNEIYSQNPIDDSLWEHETPEGYDYWEYAIYTLIIEEKK